MYEEEESMEVSGGETSPEVARLLQAASLGSPDDTRHRNNSLHNYSFDVSWTTWNKPPSPPRNPSRTAQLLSPARFTPSSTKTRPWKTLNLEPEPTSKTGQWKTIGLKPEPKHIISPATVKISQVPFKQPLGDITNTNLFCSPNKTTDSYEFDHPWCKPSRKLFSTQTTGADFDKYNKNNDLFSNFETVQQNVSQNNASESIARENIPVAEEIEETEEELLDIPRPKKVMKNGPIVKKHRSFKSGNKPPKNSSGLFMWLFVVGGVIGLGAYVYMQINFCSEFSINVKDLTKTLYANVFGQKMAVKSVLSAVETFVEQVHDDDAQRTLVLSFHGWTGVGKNYISKFIAEAFHNSRISWYLVPLHFILEDSVNHETNVKQWILGNVTKCGINVFIIDEMDKATDGLIKGVVDVIEILKRKKSESDSRDVQPVTLLIFLSNSKASQINQYLINQLEIGHDRKKVTKNEFQILFSESEWEWYHELYARELIDVFVPFLPLEEQHVRQCIIRDFENKGVNPSEQMVETVLKELSFLDVDEKKRKLSLTGCKRVQDKVDLHIED